LLFTQDRRVQIKGLAEDGCIPYDASCKAAKLDAAIQKDVWHALEDVRKVIRDVEREAFQKLKAIEQLEKRLRKHWNDAIFAEWVEFNEQFDGLVMQINQLRFWHECLWDAVELVDWRNGEIRNRAINQWLADETLKGIKQLPHPRIQKLAERLENQLPEMLTFLDGIAQPLADWQAQAEQHFQDHSAADCFQNSVARLWRLEHAVLHNGHKQFRKAALEAQQWLAAWIEDDPQIQELAEKLLNILERTVRTSCAAETINSVLRRYLVRRRECTDLTSRQLFLNLFVLWFNMHKFDRGPCQGKSPYEIAGIDLGTDDWLTLLGYPPD
jgi:Txe/YoeB family toxin of Txe-Axe toxin-antitoxin module